MLFFFVGQILSAIIIKKLSPILPVIIAAILIFIGFLISSRIQGNITFLYISYGVMCGLGIGLAYNVIVTNITCWYPDKRSTVTGILMMSFGASSLVLGPISEKLIGLTGWRTTYIIIGVSILAVLCVGCFFIKNFDAEINFSASKLSKKHGEESKEYLSTEMVKHISFWKFYILLVLLSSIGICTLSFAKDVSIKVGPLGHLQYYLLVFYQFLMVLVEL